MIIRKQSSKLARAAFTLMEMLVVVAILVVLAGAAVPIYLSYLDGAKRDRARLDIKQIESAVEAFYLENNEYPADLRVLTLPGANRRASFEEKNLYDPWGHPYLYEPQNLNQITGKPRIYTLGAGQSPDTAISNW
jgi:general secretion pathway protein G